MMYEELVKALRCPDFGDVPCSHPDCNYWSVYACKARVVITDAAAAIEKMTKHITEMHERVTVLQIDRGQLEAEVKRLKDANDELREAQTYIDHYGDKWMTSAKDVPTSAYNHGYMDGKNEAEAASPWHRVEEPPKEGQNVLTMDANEDMETATYDGEGFEDSYGFYVIDVLYWMPIEPPKEDA